MKRIINFIKTTAVGGLLVIVPVSIILFVLAQLFYSLYKVSNELIRTLGIDTPNDALLIVGITMAALIGICFVTGMLVQTRLGVAVTAWFKRHVASRIPMYNALSNLTKQFVGSEGKNFAPVEVDLYGGGARALGLLIEDLPDNRCAVFVPTAPVATVGNIYIVEQTAVTRIAGSVAETISVLTQWGVEVSDLYRPASPNAS